MAPTSMWDRAEGLAKKHDQDGGLWLKLANDQDKAVVVFLGDPHAHQVVFLNGRYTLFNDDLKAKGHKASLRVALNVALYDEKKVKVFEQGVVFFKQLLQMRSKRPLSEWAFEVQRHGAAKDPKTTYSILPERKLSAEEQAEFQALSQHDLDDLYSEDGWEEVGSYDRKIERLVDPKTAQAIAQSLKALPREAMNRFCREFGIARIKDLPVVQVNQAKAFVKALEAECSRNDNAVEIDPFA